MLTKKTILKALKLRSSYGQTMERVPVPRDHAGPLQRPQKAQAPGKKRKKSAHTIDILSF